MNPAQVSDPSAAGELPIHELMALEAVERLGSVQAAADELSVTPSGVSHRLASLERRLGIRLLQRKGRGVALTPEAADYVVAIRHGLTELARTTDELVESESGVVRIATAPAIGTVWLLPLLKSYLDEHPGARFEVLTIATADELAHASWDLLLHYGEHPRRGSLRRILFRDRVREVIAPPGADEPSRMPAADRSAGLAQLRLAQLEPPSTGRAGSTEGLGPARIVFDDPLIMLEAAAAGAGVALTTETAAAPWLGAGRLVSTASPAREGKTYFLDLSESGRLKRAAGQLHHWLLARARVQAVGREPQTGPRRSRRA